MINLGLDCSLPFGYEQLRESERSLHFPNNIMYSCQSSVHKVSEHPPQHFL